MRIHGFLPLPTESFISVAKWIDCSMSIKQIQLTKPSKKQKLGQVHGDNCQSLRYIDFFKFNFENI